MRLSHRSTIAVAGAGDLARYPISVLLSTPNFSVAILTRSTVRPLTHTYTPSLLPE